MNKVILSIEGNDYLVESIFEDFNQVNLKPLFKTKEDYKLISIDTYKKIVLENLYE